MQKDIYRDDCIKISQKTKTNKLYHYTTANGVKSILDTNEFWVTRSDFLNDKSELAYANEIIEEVCNDVIMENKVRERFLKAVKEEIIYLNSNIYSDEVDIKYGYYILSFSTEQDSITLWSEYSQFVGYSVAFNQEELIAEVKKYKGQSICWDGKVIYDKDTQKDRIKEALIYTAPQGRDATYEEIINGYSEESENTEFKHLVRDFVVICSVYAMFFKKPCFKEEKEYRIVFSAFHEERDGVMRNELKFREKDGFLIPYIVTKIKEKDELLPIHSITIAPKNTIDLAVRGMEYFMKAKGYNIPILKSQIPLRY